MAAFYSIFLQHQAAGEAQKNIIQVRSLISPARMGGREPVGFALLQCRDLPRCLAELSPGKVADFTQLRFSHVVVT